MKHLWGSLSLVNLHAVQLKKNFSIYFFLENFTISQKMSRKKKQKPSEKFLTGLALMNIFTDTF